MLSDIIIITCLLFHAAFIIYVAYSMDKHTKN